MPPHRPGSGIRLWSNPLPELPGSHHRYTTESDLIRCNQFADSVLFFCDPDGFGSFEA